MIDLNLPYLTEEHKSLAMLMKEFCEREVDLKKLNEIADRPFPRMRRARSSRARMPWDLVSKAHDAGSETNSRTQRIRRRRIRRGSHRPRGYGRGGRLLRRPVRKALTIAWKQMAAFAYTTKELAEEVMGDFMNDRKTMIGASITEPNSGSDFLLPYDEPGATGAIPRKERRG